jgi:hypothetical protein
MSKISKLLEYKNEYEEETQDLVDEINSVIEIIGRLPDRDLEKLEDLIPRELSSVIDGPLVRFIDNTLSNMEDVTVESIRDNLERALSEGERGHGTEPRAAVGGATYALSKLKRKLGSL